MNKKEAKEKTISKFTNLWDGSATASVRTIIDYYESLLKGKTIPVYKKSGIEDNFNDEIIKQIENEEENI